MNNIDEKIKIGVSACLTGDEVRYNGQAAEDKFLNRDMCHLFGFVKVCPEVGIGLGIPRETIRLVIKPDTGIRLVNHGGTEDFTEKMMHFSMSSADRLEKEKISGFVFKKSSPSCGAFRVKVYNEKGVTQAQSSMGMYAAHIQQRFPWLPIEEDGRLNDPGLRHNFLSRVFAIKYWQDHVETKPSVHALVEFHKVHKYMLMSHSQEGLRKLGQLVANEVKKPIDVLLHEYLVLFTELTSKPAPRSKHVNVLFHLMGYFSDMLDDYDRQETVNIIDKYRRGIIPLILPITRISHYVKKFKIEYLQIQSYLKHPEELGVLNKL